MEDAVCISVVVGKHVYREVSKYLTLSLYPEYKKHNNYVYFYFNFRFRNALMTKSSNYVEMRFFVTNL